ncbi:MAG TPA: efflux RND transporter periplasmic adaptor subunit, partial [Aquabacterium sp.]|nr:efflux RND transporter periplasmic adaptor subunit [Aquabacterium sp.]
GLLLVGGIARAILHRKAEQASITQTAQSTQRGQLDVTAADWVVAERAPLIRTIELSGSIRAVNSVLVKARVSGELQSLTVREGDAVRQGQLIGRIDAQDYQSRLEQARQQAASAQAQWQIAQRALDNNQALVAQGFISRNALDTSESNAAAARANLQAAEAATAVARKALADTQLHSPISGLVSQQFVQAGERVSPDARVVEVVDLSRLELEAALQAQDVAQVHVGTPGTLSVEGLSATPITATVARINPSAEPGTRAVMVYLTVAPHPALRQGLFARGHLDLGRVDSVVLPRSAVRQGTSGAFVQIVRQGKVVHQRVQLGAEGVLARSPDTPMVAVTQGLTAGERVLRESLGLLREGTLIVSPR